MSGRNNSLHFALRSFAEMFRDANVRCAHTRYARYLEDVRICAWGNLRWNVVTPSRPHKFMKFVNSQLWPHEYRYEKAAGKKNCRLNLL